MKVNAKRVHLKFSPTVSLEEAKVLPVIEKFMAGIAEKDANILEGVLSDDAEIQLLRRRNIFLGKKEYIQFITKEAAEHYRSDFRLRDVTMDSYDNWVLARGKFEFADNSRSHLLYLKVVPGWRIQRVFYSM